ncbi:MAG: peptidoglycan DD-metalloendopeptidase family protein [Desulfobulbaceae bacterium]|nr:peptidoglycan DD-metalloendopeptidase family protein [Desulfobulbaceae bacterium]
MATKRFLPICLLAAAIGLLPAPAPGADEITSPKNALLQQQKKVQRLQQGIEEHTKRISQTKAQESNLLSELEAIDKRLRDERSQMQSLSTMLAEQEQALLATESEVTQVSDEKSHRQGPVKERLAAYYRVGDIGVMNLLFSASTLPDLIKFKEYFHRVVQHDQQIICGYRQTLEKLGHASTDLQNKKKNLVQIIDSISAQQQRLDRTRAERLTLLNRVKTEKELYSRAVQEMQQAADDLVSTISKLKKTATEQPASPAKEYPDLQSPKKKRPQTSEPRAIGKGFAAQKGRLPPPVEGTVTTRFGSNVTEKFGIATVQNGIDISTTPDAEVHAIYDGTVVYTGIMRGYGNLIIIDHGNEYYSLSSRIAKLLVEEGAKVQRGQTIGAMGDVEGLLAEGLHFEIRYGTKPQNPLLWLDASKLKQAKP